MTHPMMHDSTALPVPETCTVLVVGGGPGGSYTASILAREGVDVVLLEADTFPRYHIGESLLPALRFLTRFIDVDSTIEAHGFQKKTGATFKFNEKNREGYTDFLAAYGEDHYVWNVLRSEFDDILFRHAIKSGAKVFEGVKVDHILFETVDSDGAPSSTSSSLSSSSSSSSPTRPVRATFQRTTSNRKNDGSSTSESGTISFRYIVDATGRAGLLSTKYLKNRTYNQSLKNIAWWGYWKGTAPYAPGTTRENVPFFEALRDESGWAWAIPLREYTSVGLVMNQDISVEKKRTQTPVPSTEEFYLQQLKLTPNLWGFISSGKLIDCPNNRDGGGGGTGRVKSASDYSYSASTYSGPGYRIVGDAGAFIDPFFSSGVHLAMSGGLSAAATICAELRGDCSAEEAANWHTERVAQSYTWFLMVVMGAYKQMRAQNEAVLSDIDEDNFDRAFEFLKPVIQGTMDIKDRVSQEEIAKTLEFCTNLFSTDWSPEAGSTALKKLAEVKSKSEKSNPDANAVQPDSESNLTDDERVAVEYIKLTKNMHWNENITGKSIAADVVQGRALRLERGRLGLEQAGVDFVVYGEFA